MSQPPDETNDLPPGASPRSGLPPPVATRWKKGQSGNPGGRPKGQSLVALLREVLEREHNGRPIKELVAERIVKEALSGKFPYAKELLDRLEGPVNQRHDVNHSNEVRILVEDIRGNTAECGSLREFYTRFPAPPALPASPGEGARP